MGISNHTFNHSGPTFKSTETDICKMKTVPICLFLLSMAAVGLTLPSSSRLIGKREAVAKNEQPQVVDDNDEETNEINNFIDGLTTNLKSPKKALEQGKDVIKKIAYYVQQAEAEISDIYGQIAKITEGEAQLQKSFIHQFAEAKSNLRKSRQEVRALAQETVSLTQDVIVLMDHNEDIVVVEVEVAIQSLKELLSRTKELLSKAKVQYNLAITTMDKMEGDLKIKIVELEALGDEKSVKYQKFAKDVRGGVYGGCGAVTAGMIIADVFGCFGICSATATSACWVTAIPSVEATLATYRAAVGEMKNKTEEVKHQIESLGSVVDDAINALETEIDILVRWDAVAGRLSAKLEKKTFQAKILAKVKRIRAVLVSGVKDLQNVANEFLALPEVLFKYVEEES